MCVAKNVKEVKMNTILNTNYQKANLNTRYIRKRNQNISFTGTKSAFEVVSKNSGTTRNVLLAATLFPFIKLIELFGKLNVNQNRRNEINAMTEELKRQYEDPNCSYEDFENTTKKINDYLNNNQYGYPYYIEFVKDAMKFLSDNFNSESGISNRFERFKDDKGDYKKRFDKFMLLVQQSAELVVAPTKRSVDRNTDWYKFNKDGDIAYKIMIQNTSGLSDKELNGDTYAFNLYSFTDEEADWSKLAAAALAVRNIN